MRGRGRSFSARQTVAFHAPLYRRNAPAAEPLEPLDGLAAVLLLTVAAAPILPLVIAREVPVVVRGRVLNVGKVVAGPKAALVGTITTLTASAVLTGSYYESGTITFTLYDSNGNLVDTEPGTRCRFKRMFEPTLRQAMPGRGGQDVTTTA